MEEQKVSCRILLCNLFLSMTVFFFQPLESILINLKMYQINFDNIWWVQLLIGIVFSILLSTMMLLLPRKLKGIAASISFGIGIAFLLQSLLFNEGRYFSLGENWPMKLLSVYVWVGIIIIIVVMDMHFDGKKEKKDYVICAIAWSLIIIQGINFIVLSTIVDKSAFIKENNASSIIEDSYKMIKISMIRGLPYIIKDLI